MRHHHHLCHPYPTNKETEVQRVSWFDCSHGKWVARPRLTPKPVWFLTYFPGVLAASSHEERPAWSWVSQRCWQRSCTEFGALLLQIPISLGFQVLEFLHLCLPIFNPVRQKIIICSCMLLTGACSQSKWCNQEIHPTPVPFSNITALLVSTCFSHSPTLLGICLLHPVSSL